MTLRPRTIRLEKGDEVTLQYLGAALVIQWSELSEQVQQTILRQAMSMGGLPPLTSLNEQIKSLISRTKEEN
jgi:hypothetical protein